MVWPFRSRPEPVAWLEAWFQRHCNGTWEDDHAIKIQTVDAPGWYVSIDVSGTPLQDVFFDPVVQATSERDFIQCNIEQSCFRATCSPQHLQEVLQIFIAWAEKHS